MDKRQRVILYGNSLIMDGVRASLDVYPCLEVLALDPPLNLPEGVSPAAIIFDLTAAPPDFPSSYLQYTSLLLIGIDPAFHRALVWSGRQEIAIGIADLIGIIQR